jgi:arylsulfatase A-like enzyme
MNSHHNRAARSREPLCGRNRFTLALAIGASLLGIVAAVSAETNRPPNLIVIMTDDQGYADVGFNGCKDIPTPNLDSIAQNGVRFTSGYVVYPVCSPSRAGFITGRYPQRFGYERNPRFQPENRVSGLALTETTLADALGKVGYHSGIIGKWHLGVHPDLHPLQRGFNEFFGHLGGGARYFPEELALKEASRAMDEGQSYRLWMMRNHEPVRTTGYLTDEFSNEAVQFVTRNKDKPFFLYLSYNAPHTPMQASEKYLSRFTNITNPQRRTYAAMVSAVDDGVGRLLATLREQGLEKQTLVFFLSDNGGPEQANASNNGPLRGSKSDAWEGGIRVPFAAQWPGQLPKGMVYDKPVLSLDIFATIAALAGAPTNSARPLDGVNLLPYLTGKNAGAPHEAIYLRKFDQGAFAIRRGDYKLVIPRADANPQLFNLATDLGETNNLAATQPEILGALEQLRVAWNAQLIPPVFEGLMVGQNPPAARKPTED